MDYFSAGLMQIGLSELSRWFQLRARVKPLSDVLDPFIVHALDKKDEMVVVLDIALACVFT